MIAPEVAARIRRLYYAEHWRIGTIATELGVHHDAVARVLGRTPLGRASTPRPVRPSVLDPYKPFLADVLAQHPRLRATRLHAMLQGRGYPGGVITVRRYVRTIRPARRVEAYLRLQTLPGEQGPRATPKTGQCDGGRRDVDAGGGHTAPRRDGERLECRETTAGDRAGATGLVAPPD
jgi:transposase